jgi:hypothetical protein
LAAPCPDAEKLGARNRESFVPTTASRWKLQLALQIAIEMRLQIMDDLKRKIRVEAKK